MKLDALRAGASVISRDGHKLGTLGRFVVNKDTFALTHIVVDTGLLRSGESLWKGGWGLSHDRVLPVGVLESADSDEVRITMSADEFKDLSVDYIQERFEQIPDEKPGWPDLSDVQRLVTSLPGEPGPYFMYEVMAKSPDEVDIKKGSRVWRLRSHEKIGEVEHVIFDEDSKKVTALVIRRGFVFSKDVVLPVERIVEVVGDIVRVDIDDDALRQLEEYRPGD